MRRIMFGLLLILSSAVVSGGEVSAQGGVYPPLAEACNRYPGSLWQVPGDEVVGSYLGCFIDQGVDAAGDIACPDGTYPQGNLCFPVVEEDLNDLNDGWYDELGNLVPNQGECPAGFLVWPSPENGLDHDICAETPEEVSGPVEQPAEGGHQPWRDGPRGRCADWMDAPACQVWQRGYDFPDENGDCLAPAAPVEGSPETGWFITCQVISGIQPPEAVEQNPQLVTDEPPASERAVYVTALPDTGNGSTQESKEMSLSLWLIILIFLLLMAAVAIAPFLDGNNLSKDEPPRTARQEAATHETLE